MKVLFAAVLIPAVVVVGFMWVSDDRGRPDPLQSVNTADESPTTVDRVPVALSVGGEVLEGPSTISKDRVNIVEEERLAREKTREELFRELLADLPPDWVTPIEAPAAGEGPMVAGVRHGDWTIHYPDNDWTDKGKFVLGSQQGQWLLYDSFGTLIRTRTFLNGKLHGTMRDRPDANSPWTSYEYRDGQLVE